LLGFSASNLSGLDDIDPTLLGDVSLAGTATTLASDVDQSATLAGAEGSVVYRLVTQSDNSQIGVYVARSWNVAVGASVHVTGAYPIAFVAYDAITIGGTLDASSLANVAGAGATAPDTLGVGTGHGGDGTTGDGAAAAGGSFCGAGGGGGSYSVAVPASLGTAYGTATLVPLVAGSSGGVGLQPAGAGGGAIQLVARTSISVTGTLAANGGGGGESGAVTEGAVVIGSGGGSGGALLLEAPIVSVTGTLAANGGGGGGNSASHGQDGQSSATPATGTGTGTGLGGNGNGGAIVGGTAGGAGSGAYGTGNDIAPAGGGGGAGRIRINTTSGSATVTNAILSPASGTTCLSQGTIAL
jgi:hypothetical protein